MLPRGHAGFAGVAVFRRASLGLEVAQRLAPGEALVRSVPEGDLVLAKLPAEEDLPAVAQRGEVEEATVEVLDQDALGLDPLHDSRELGGRLLELLISLGEVRRRQVAAVRDHLGAE